MAQTLPRPSVPPEVLHELHHGHRLEAIRLLRGATGMGLKEAKATLAALENAPLAAMQPHAANVHMPKPAAHTNDVPGALAPGEQSSKETLWWLLLGALLASAAGIWLCG